MKIAVMTDVNAGLDYIGYDSGIACLRSSVNFGDEVLVDGIDIKADEFYERIKNITDPKDIPSTSAPAIGDIMQTIEKFIEEGYTDAIMDQWLNKLRKNTKTKLKFMLLIQKWHVTYKDI